MPFDEAWLSPASRTALDGLVRSVADIPGSIIEIGAWQGRSTVVMANAAAPRIVDTVDTWAGSASDETGDMAARRDIHATWVANVATLTAGNVVEHWMDWREFVPTIVGPVALVFIDAEHTYKEVFDCVSAFVPLMSAGGVICGDDISCPDVCAAVTDVVGEYVTTAALWSWVKP